MQIVKGDRVRVTAGKDKGRDGRVLRTEPAKERVYVEGLNVQKHHTRASQKNPTGGIIDVEGPIHVSNVMLLCPSCSQPTRVGKVREEGVVQRVCRKCEKPIDK
jgi:large subunit ribosomal protein L24